MSKRLYMLYIMHYVHERDYNKEKINIRTRNKYSARELTIVAFRSEFESHWELEYL